MAIDRGAHRAVERSTGLVNEFKSFISRGNVIDMAVGIIIGAAFTSIVTSLVRDIVMPIVGAVTGGVDFTSYSTTIGTASIAWGTFIQNVINFLLVALVVFVMVKSIARLQRKEEKPAEPQGPSDEVVILTQIRDLLERSAR